MSDRAFIEHVVGTALLRATSTTAGPDFRTRFGDRAPVIQRAVAAHTSGESTTAPLLAPGTSSFLALVTPRTVFGRLTRASRAPFHTGVAAGVAASAMQWRAEGAPFPLGRFAWQKVSLPRRSAGGIVVLSRDVLRDASAGAEIAIETTLRDALVKFTDASLLDPTADATPARPASITYGATTLVASGVDGEAARADLLALIGLLSESLATLDGVVLILSEANAVGLAALLNPGGTSAFPDIGAAGGTLFGLPVIVSSVAGDQVVALHAPSLLVADRGELTIEVSEHAALEMSATPAHDASTPTPAELVSLWQTDSVGLLVQRWLNFELTRPDAVAVLTGAQYFPAS